MDGLNEALVTTQHYCSLLNDEIKRVQNVLLKKSRNSEATPPTANSIGLAKLSQLEAELEQEQAEDFSPPLHHPLAISTLLLHELESTVDQTEKLLQVAKVRCTALDEEVEEKENLVLDQTKLSEALLERLQVQPDPPSEVEDSQFVATYCAELQEKKRVCDVMRRDVKKKMKNFAQRHFPPPTSSDDVLALDHVINELITLSVEQPEQPYLTMGSQHSSPYIELLLSNGLALRHPTDINKIKLCDLHL